jgi:hypothetical protein
MESDALLTYLDAHADDKQANPATPDDLGLLSSAIRKLAGLLIAADDSYDSQVKAQDLLYGHNYSESPGGSIWHYDGRAVAGQGPPTPSADEAKVLASLNEAQAILDATTKELELARWSLFAQWWNLVADPLDNVNPQAKHDQYTAAIQPIIANIATLGARQKERQAFIQTATNLDPQGKQILPGQAKPYKRAAKDPYYIRKDPTVCIAGMASGWPANFSDPLNCRMESQLVAGPSDPHLSSKAPKDLGTLQSLCQKLLSEFLVHPDDPKAVPRPGWKLWNDTQPWFP